MEKVFIVLLPVLMQDIEVVYKLFQTGEYSVFLKHSSSNVALCVLKSERIVNNCGTPVLVSETLYSLFKPCFFK